MASQPVSKGDQYVLISGGTSVTNVSDSPATLSRLLIGGTYVGTLAIYDSATVAGTAAGNLVYTVGLPALAIANNIDLNINMKKGITYTATGTPVMTLTFDK